jgi:hypothetical protein
MFKPAVFAIGCALATIAPAQVDFVAVNIAPALDTLYWVDITNPTGTPQTPPVATTVGNFIRGVELINENTGYYVATSSSSGSPTGFYRLDDGVSTLVAPLPFTSTAVGGLSFGPGDNFLYWSSDPPTGDDELWTIGLDGVFTLIGPITVPGVTSVVISGLALDPISNNLYAIETGIDSLLLVDQSTGAASIVGPLGVAISAVGGLDFALDGTNRLFMASPTAVYEVNPVTGTAGPTLGTLPSSTSSLAAIPSRVRLRLPTLTLGGTENLTLRGGDPTGFFGLYYSSNASFLPIAPTGVVRIDVTSPFFSEILTFAFDPSGEFTLPIGLPNDPNLLTLTGVLQAYVVGSTTPSLKLTNAVTLLVQ